MVTELKVTPKRGGFRRPISVRAFILEHLERVGEDYPASIHRAYKRELEDIALANGRCHRDKNGKLRGRPYHRPVYHSTEMAVQKLAREELVEFSGREEESDNPQFSGWENKPLRRYYRLKR